MSVSTSYTIPNLDYFFFADCAAISDGEAIDFLDSVIYFAEITGTNPFPLAP